MSYTKVSVTLQSKVAAELRRTTGPRGMSAFVNEAVRQKLQAVRVRQLLAELDQEHGPVPQAVKDDVDTIEWPD